MSSPEEIKEAFKEIYQFLDTLTPNKYKDQVLEYILGMTGTASGVKAITEDNKLLTAIKKLIMYDTSKSTQMNSLKIIVNITSSVENELIYNVFMEAEFVNVMLRVAIDTESECSDLAVMLLTNLTQLKNNAETVINLLKNNSEKFTIKNFVDAFCGQSYNKKECNLHHLGSFIANLTVFSGVRRELLADKAALFARLFPFTQYEKSLARRKAVARIIKNCLFETECHETVLSDDVDILPHLLLPMAGPEEFSPEENESLPIDLQYLPDTKLREPSEEIQIMICESLFQLCATKNCRLKMKASGVYYILRELHKAISSESVVLEPLENVIHVLIGDEPDKDKENLRTVEIPENIQRKFEMLSKDAVEE